MLELAGIRKSFNVGADNEIEVLHGIDLCLYPGDFCAVVGPSGSGKSTLLNTVGLLDRPSSGSLRITGLETTQLSDAQLTHLRGHSIGFVFQYHHLLSAFSALENVMMPMYAAQGLMDASMRARAAQLLESVGMRPWLDATPEGLPAAPWQAAVARCERALVAASAAVRAVDELGPAFTALAERCDTLLQNLQLFATAPPEGQVRWLEVGAQVQLSQSPLTIAEPMRALARPDAAPGTQPKSWIFTSATLGTDAQLRWFVDACGLEGAQVLRVASPFDYATQAAVYVPREFPRPQDAAHSAAVAALAAQGASALGGRTMVLTTTTRAMRAIADALRQQFAAAGLDTEVLVQGQAPKRELVDRFVGAGVPQAGFAGGCVLVATASFWEGIDIAGDALQLLVIDKLPFAPPDDPLVQARASAQVAGGGNAFKNLHLPQAAIALKQGAGRLIRSETDRGILVVCDVRLAQMGYGKKLLEGLPPMRRLADGEHWLEALADLAAARQAPA